MKSTRWLALAVAVIVLLNLRGTGDAAGKRGRDKPAKPGTPVVAPKVDDVVDGYGPTPEQARESALKNSRERVEELLTRRLRGTGWTPTAEQLDLDFLVRHNVIQPRGEPEVVPPVNIDDKPALIAHCRVELTHDYLKEIETTARQQTVQERHSILARLLAGILAVALVTAGYLRLEESTRGYATKLLRLGAVVVLAVVAAGLYLTR